MDCLVLGGAGFIGSHVVDRIIEADHRARVFDMPNISLRNLETNIDRVEFVGLRDVFVRSFDRFPIFSIAQRELP